MSNTQKTRILLVDDTASLTQTYKAYLAAQGYDVRCSYTGRDAVDDLRRYGADVLLLDLDLPDCSGLDVMEQTRGQVDHPPIIIITGSDDPTLHNKAKKSGAQSVLVKPISMDRLQTAIASALNTNANARTHHASTLEPFETMPGDIAGVQPIDVIDMVPTNHTRQSRTSYNTPGFSGFIGTSPVMQTLYDHLQNAARSNATAFITGESGTGKEVCAEAIHRHSKRANGPFVPLNCAAIPRDLLESELFGHVRGAFTGAINDRDGAAKLADGGTLFLDEIGDMDMNMQTKLLRFLQDGTFQRVGGSRLEQVDVRIICATNRNPLDDVRTGRFRADLFYRLHVLPITMPPLRSRGEDVIDIAQTLLLRYSAEEGRNFQGFDEDATAMLRRYNWPGNIRQLQNVIRNVVVMHTGPLVRGAMISQHLLHSTDTSSAHNTPGMAANMAAEQGITPMTVGDLTGHDAIPPLHETERRAIEHAINVCGGNIPRAAALLAVSPSTIYRKKVAWEQTDPRPHKR